MFPYMCDGARLLLFVNGRMAHLQAILNSRNPINKINM